MSDASTPELARLREAAAAAQKALEEAERAAERAPAEEPAEAPEGYAAQVAAGYAAEATLPLGALLEGEPGGEATPNPQVQVGFALSMLNRHGLVAGATGTGKTKTLQGMAEGLSLAGVPVFLADIKGDLSGLAVPGADNPKVAERAASIGQDWTPTQYPVEFYSLGGIGKGVPIRTTVSDFGPLLMSKVLGLNETQESSLSLIFHWADKQGLALLDLKDLQSVIAYLTSDEGKGELKGIGGVSAATAGVILREIVGLEGQGADVFFGEPAFATSDLIATRDDLGVLSVLELPAVQDRPQLFSTFLMWLLADLFQELPEVGDADRPKLVFFFDEAHLLFADASKDFLQQVVQTVRLIRSKGVGVFFVTQSPKDVPADVLAQLGNRVQHALRAFTPDDATALRAAARTFPTSPYDLERLLQELGTGEAVVTVLTEKGAPSPWPGPGCGPRRPRWTPRTTPRSTGWSRPPRAGALRHAGRRGVGVRAAPGEGSGAGGGPRGRRGVGHRGRGRTRAGQGARPAGEGGRDPRARSGPAQGADHARAQPRGDVTGPDRGHGHRPGADPLPVRHPPPLSPRSADHPGRVRLRRAPGLHR
nr:hypothetical protein GCM10025730_46350 [Promicromonospora thailandica]